MTMIEEARAVVGRLRQGTHRYGDLDKLEALIAEHERLTAPPTDDEWEYGVKREYVDGWESGHRLDDRHYVDTRYAVPPKGGPNVMRRRKAGPWEPVESARAAS